MKKAILNIIKVRKQLIRIGKSGKNTARCLQIIERLEAWINAYSPTEQQWRKFAQRKEQELRYLCPENKAGETLWNNIIKHL